MSSQIGRVELFTDVTEITKENVIPIVQKAFSEYMPTINRVDFLLNYDAGIQPLQRKEPKKYRADIDCHCVDNVANEITEFKLGFNWGCPITFVQRGAKDSGTVEESEAISLLNECYEAERINEKTQKLARFVEVCGIGYSYVEINKDYEPGDSYFKVEILDPRYAFVIRSSYYMDNRVMLGVSFRKDGKGNRYFTCFSKKDVFIIKNLFEIVNGEIVPDDMRWQHESRSGEMNPMQRIPITEYIRSFDRLGAWERQISEMDNLNLLISDMSNDVEQNTQAMWHTNDVEFPVEKVTIQNSDGTTEETEVIKKPKSGEWMQTFTTQDGKTPIVEALAINYDYSGMLNNIITRRSLILQKCDVPSRNDNSGGSTGIAMDSATGYADAETSAQKEQNIIEGCKMEEVKSVLSAIRASTDVPADSPLLTLTYMDVQPSIERNKKYELTTKINFFATAVSHGIYGLHALKAMDAFKDVNQVWNDSKELIEAYQRSIFEKDINNAVGGEGEEKPDSDRISQDMSDQINNSPFIDGTRTA